ncbi:pepsin-like aspartic protease [Paraburkholderia sp. MM5477-R1]|uniref:pepsin-like aspartic protease n=1 Tax=Paraburkholderia sp. MM5477-R1 TaxID=2991062 RepID=UPI003D1D87D1
MSQSVRIPITNINMDGDYTGAITVGTGSAARTLNVILDTGSSALAVNGDKYSPQLGNGTTATNLAQFDAYGDGSNWLGSVLKDTVKIGNVTGSSVAVAVTYQESANMFREADGILGLAYQALDDAYSLPESTWPKKYSKSQVEHGTRSSVIPCLMQLANEGVLQEKMAFLTRRSFCKAGVDPDNDPLNQGVLILGGGEEATDLYSGDFQIAAVLADAWYSTNLLSVGVGTEQFPISARPQPGMPSNSIVDSGTNTLVLGPTIINGILSRLQVNQQELLKTSMSGQPVSVTSLDLSQWPPISFTLQGISGGQNVALSVPPQIYWQIDAPAVGQAMAAISPVRQDGGAILGLPLMNGYFTIFDGTAGLGVIKFAAAK